MSLPLSKYYDPEKDLPALADELVYVDAHFTKDAPQSEHRRWEYAMALRALYIWEQEGHRVSRVVDVGGAGSPFWRMLDVDNVQIIDPSIPGNCTLAGFVKDGSRTFSSVFCLSVLEHVEDLDQFLYHLSCLVAPGGLLFLTVDCCGCEDHLPEEDPHHFSGMRKRIFTYPALKKVGQALLARDFALLQGMDYLDYQPRLYGGATDPGYSFASLALVKRS